MSAKNTNFWTTRFYNQAFEFRSQTEICGLPLVHIAHGFDPETGRVRIARGIIALGDIAVGAVALGGITVGIIGLGGISIASLAIGGIALGGQALGGIAVALCTAIGVIAVSPGTALGLQVITPQLSGLAGKLLSFFAR